MLDKIQSKISQLVEVGESVCRTEYSLEHVMGPSRVKSDLFYEWKAASLSFLQKVFGEKSTHFNLFSENCKDARHNDAIQGLGILKAAKQEIESGFLVGISELAAADIFSSFIEIAKHLVENKYKDPAASLVGAVLEDGLRKITVSQGITLKATEDISSLNQKLADNQVYTRLMQKRIQIWNEVRNNADHGHFDRYTLDDVLEMMNGVEKLLAEHLDGN